MRAFARVLLGVVFSINFLVFVFLSSINFQFLNKSYLFYVFDSTNIYAQILDLAQNSLPNDPKLPLQERVAYTSIAKKFSPQILEKTIKDNLVNCLDFIWGKTDKINIFLPAKDLGLGRVDIHWSPNSDIYKSLKGVNGLGRTLIFAWLFALLTLIALFIFVYLLTEKRRLVGVGSLLTINGVLFILVGSILEGGMFFVVKTLPISLEPAQALLKLSFSTILPQLVLLWIVWGFIVVCVGILLRRAK